MKTEQYYKLLDRLSEMLRELKALGCESAVLVVAFDDENQVTCSNAFGKKEHRARLRRCASSTIRDYVRNTDPPSPHIEETG